jgi:hypothetical protein
MFVVAAAAATYAVPVGNLNSDEASAKARVSEAAKNCGTRVVFVDLPPNKWPAGPSSFGYNIDSHATSAQRLCLYKKVPSTRVGFISAPPDQEPWASMSPQRKAILLDEISRRCKIPRAWFVIKGSDGLRLRPKPGTPFEPVDCALKRLQPYNPFMGFVGNETYNPDRK